MGTLSWRRDDAAQSIVEVALLLPVLVFGLIGGADLARAFAVQLAVQNGARAGAEAYAISARPTLTMAQDAAVSEMNRTPTVGATRGNVQVTKTTSDGESNCPNATPTVANPCFVTVRVQYTFQTTIPWPWIPNSASFDRTTTMRTFY